MCDPITIAGIALTGASTVANSIGASKANAARNDALAAERIRQQGFDRENAATNQQSQDRYSNINADQAAKTTELGDYFNSQNSTAATANADATAQSTIPQSGSPLIVQEDAKQTAKANAFVSQQGDALGALRAFGDVLGTASRGQARDAAEIGTINGFKQGSSNILPLELDAAQQKGAGLRTFGDILGLGGQLLTSKGLSGKTTTPSTLSNVIGYTPTNSASYFPAAPKSGLYNLFGN